MNSIFKKKLGEIQHEAKQRELDLKAERNYNWYDIEKEKHGHLIWLMIGVWIGGLFMYALLKFL